MTFSARVYRVLIASPSDVIEEREIAVRAIQEWNDLNAAERSIVLLPLRWETHTAPEYGKRPQEVINRQVVDNCDILVCTFWTRIGSPTGVAAGGSIEEIERVAKSGKPVMIYFSEAKLDPSQIDLDQLAKLREFKSQTFPKALIDTYSTSNEFRDKLSKHLEIQLRSLVAEQSEGGVGEVSPITDIVLHFAEVATGADAGVELTLETRVIVVPNFDDIPDYLDDPAGREVATSRATQGFVTLGGGANKDFYRQSVTGTILQSFYRPVRFWLKNRGGVGARDVHVDLSIARRDGDFSLVPTGSFPSAAPREAET